MISVVIATKNREDALRSISLPSLLNQDSGNFEVVLWDVSDTDASRIVADSFRPSFEKKGIDFRYFKGTRCGITSQRNDALDFGLDVMGEIVFFIDDDCEISPDGLSGLRSCLDEHPESMGAGLVVYQSGPDGQVSIGEDGGFRKRLYDLVGYKKKRRVSLSGSGKGISALAGPAEWLSGGSMAFRKTVFESMRFNEKLETFGPYAIFDDIEFSHRVYRRYGSLFVAERGWIIHRSAPGDRLWGVDRAAATFYNRYLSMKVASADHPFLGLLSYGWAVVRRTIKMSRQFGFEKTFKGFLLALKEIGREKR